MPRGVSHDQWYADPFPIYMSRAKGSRLWDVDGNEYVDYYGGHGGKMLGHAPAAVVAAVQDQIQNGTQYGAACERSVEWAELIQKLVPSAELIEFMNSGTEAIMYGIRLARAFTGRNKIVKFEGQYHGVHDYALISVSPNNVADLGDADNPVNLWQWKPGWQAEVEGHRPDMHDVYSSMHVDLYPTNSTDTASDADNLLAESHTSPVEDANARGFGTRLS